MKFHFILPWAMLSFIVFLEQPLIKRQAQAQGELNLVGGRMGADGRNVIQTKRADYIFSLLFLIEGSEETLGDLQRRSEDAGGNTFQDAVFDDLVLFADFKPGDYLVRADRDGHSIDKAVYLGTKTAASPSFNWPR